MVIDYNPMKMAVEMMISALTLLDAIGETSAATMLQHALDIVTRAPVATRETDDPASA